MTPKQMRLATGFATGLGKMKAKEEQGLGCELTPDEVAGMIWAIRNLRAGASRDAANPS